MKRAKEWTDSTFESLVQGKVPSNISGKTRRERWAIAASQVSIKKTFPPSCTCLEKGYAEKHKEKVSKPVYVRQSYLDFVERETEKMFPPGWDAGYFDKCAGASRSLSACKERGRSKGGAFATEESREEFLRKVQGHEEVRIDAKVKFAVIQSAGKPRPLTITSSSFEYLRPLHGLIYDRISSFPWLCRGNVTPELLEKRGFRKEEGSLFVSGDFEGATDNLSTQVAESILFAMFRTSRAIPESIKREALRSVGSLVAVYGSDEVRIKRGQMMGSLLSFPLLCLQNRLSFLGSVTNARDLPCLINGDDLLFQGARWQADQWFEGVGALGLKVSAGKTLVHKSVCCLNSTYFELTSSKRTGRTAHYIPFIRVKQFTTPDDPTGLVGTLQQVLKPLGDTMRVRAAEAWLEANRRLFDKLGRSLYVIGLTSIDAVRSVIKTNPWLRLRERLFRSSPERVLPSFGNPHNVVCSGLVEVDVPSEKFEPIRDAVREYMIDSKWALRSSFRSNVMETIQEDFWQEVEVTGANWRSLIRQLRARKRTKKIFKGIPRSACSQMWFFVNHSDKQTTNMKMSSKFGPLVPPPGRIEKSGYTRMRVPKEWVECGDFGLGRREVVFRSTEP
uniref:RNA dependent RNA polymerase n=1 Tax=Erysiphe necator associated ourmia-like virus 4 TaxID=2689562 RepID=A0A6B9KAM8_9VIRU|nr:RNA dependent RNA polymerase [Erysiphe necator associated ourmia-like virus 4]